MHLMYILNEDGKRIYTLKKALQGRTTSSAHPARFSPDDKFANERLRLQTRFAAKLEGSHHFPPAHNLDPLARRITDLSVHSQRARPSIWTTSPA